MVVIIPAAGNGKRFSDAGYMVPKPYLEARGVPMLYRVMEMFEGNPNISGLLPVVQHAHAPYFEDMIVKHWRGKQKMPFFVQPVLLHGVLLGAALSVLAAGLAAALDDDVPVMVVNSDNLFPRHVMLEFTNRCELAKEQEDGCIMTFDVPDGGRLVWSYVHLVDNGGTEVFQVTEKHDPTDMATAGAYYFSRWTDLRRAIASMIQADERLNNEFYLAPVYNYLLEFRERVGFHHIKSEDMICLGTPADLQQYNVNVQKSFL